MKTGWCAFCGVGLYAHYDGDRKLSCDQAEAVARRLLEMDREWRERGRQAREDER